MGDPAARSVEEIILTYPGFQAITVHRVAHWLHSQGVPFIPRIMSEHAHTGRGSISTRARPSALVSSSIMGPA